MAVRLKTIYQQHVVPSLIENFLYKNIQQVPKLDRIVVRCGMERVRDPRAFDATLCVVTGQTPGRAVVKKTAYDAFKSKQRDAVEEFVHRFVTLRGNIMYSFLDRLINMGFPKKGDIRDGNVNTFDGHGNFTIRMRGQSIVIETMNEVPELIFDSLNDVRSMDVSINTTAETDLESKKLLALMGMQIAEGTAVGPGNIKKKKVVNFQSLRRRTDPKSKKKK